MGLLGSNYGRRDGGHGQRMLTEGLVPLGGGKLAISSKVLKKLT